MLKNYDLKFLRKLILEVAAESKEGHIPSALSILDIVYVLYKEYIFIDTKSINNKPLNRFILSKGHASLGLYVTLYHFGTITREELFSFTKYNSKLGGHPDRNKVSEIELSTGSLGHGLPQGIGIAIASRIKKDFRHIYILIGDGEANEGTVWESALLAHNYKLGSITCIVDNNLSSERALDMGNIGAKFQAFGWETYEINGHDHKEISKALNIRNSSKPICIVANTIKGFGIPAMESNPEWHHRSPNSEELSLLLKEIL